jgi:hypothetical protein
MNLNDFWAQYLPTLNKSKFIVDGIYYVPYSFLSQEGCREIFKLIDFKVDGTSGGCYILWPIKID